MCFNLEYTKSLEPLWLLALRTVTLSLNLEQQGLQAVRDSLRQLHVVSG
jgi:hypothetical protein